MKKLIIHIVVVFMIGNFALAQNNESKEPNNTPQAVAPLQSTEKETAKVDDAEKEIPKESDAKKRNFRNRSSEHFIDKDGDGINDNRCNGFGIQRKNIQKGRRGGGKR